MQNAPPQQRTTQHTTHLLAPLTPQSTTTAVHHNQMIQQHTSARTTLLALDLAHTAHIYSNPARSTSPAFSSESTPKRSTDAVFAVTTLLLHSRETTTIHLQYSTARRPTMQRTLTQLTARATLQHRLLVQPRGRNDQSGEHSILTARSPRTMPRESQLQLPA